MTNPTELGTGGKVATALSLTAIGGFVDAVGYIALFQIFTANMSGNSIHIGMYLGHGDWANLLRPLCAVISYVVGMALTRIALEAAARGHVRRIASLTFAVEAVLLAFFAHGTPKMHLGQITDLHSALYFSFVAMLSFAMGVQTATITHVGALTIYTTFVTGTLTKMTESLTRIFFWVYDELRQSGMSHIVRQMRRQSDVRDAAMLAALWLMYVIGATLGLLAKERWNLRALYLPVALLIVFIVIDRLRPLGVQEEKAQTRS